MNKFCPKCNYLLDIKKNINLLKIDDENKLINLLSNGTINIDTNINLNKIKENEKFTNLKIEEKEIILNNYKKTKELNKFGFYNCLNCNYFTNIENGTILIDSSKSTESKSELYLKLQSKNNILPRTRDYICPNKNCKASDKLFTEREAVFYRINKTYKIAYLCCICDTEWTI